MEKGITTNKKRPPVNCNEFFESQQFRKWWLSSLEAREEDGETTWIFRLNEVNKVIYEIETKSEKAWRKGKNFKITDIKIKQTADLLLKKAIKNKESKNKKCLTLYMKTIEISTEELKRIHEKFIKALSDWKKEIPIEKN